MKYRYPVFSAITRCEPQEKCAHKKGEVVEPAGGETGEPHCLAEVYQLLRSSFDSSANLKEQPIELLRKILSAKKRNNHEK